VHALIEAYGLLRLRDLTIVSPRKATVKELCRFHSRDFIGSVFFPYFRAWPLVFGSSCFLVALTISFCRLAHLPTPLLSPEFLNKAEEYDSDQDSDEDSNDDDNNNNDNDGRGTKTKAVHRMPAGYKVKRDKLEEYGLRHDCSVFEGIADYAAWVAGSTIEAATLLGDDAFDIVIHWDGGR